MKTRPSQPSSNADAVPMRLQCGHSSATAHLVGGVAVKDIVVAPMKLPQYIIVAPPSVRYRTFPERGKPNGPTRELLRRRGDQAPRPALPPRGSIIMPGDEGPQNFGLPSHTRQNEREQREQGALPDLMLADARRCVCIE